jgi:hypothetical protein
MWVYISLNSILVLEKKPIKGEEADKDRSTELPTKDFIPKKAPAGDSGLSDASAGGCGATGTSGVRAWHNICW